MRRRPSYMTTQPSSVSSLGGGPRIFRILSRTSVFVPYIIVIILLLAINAACSYLRVNSCTLADNGSIVVNGSTALAPLVQDVAKEYQQKCFGAQVSVNSGGLPQGSVNGLLQVEQGKITIGTSDIFANPTQNSDLEDHQVAVVVFTLVVNSDVDISNLTTDQIRRVYSGDITNWNQVNSTKNLDIVRISRPPTSGTRATFEKYVLSGIETVSGPQSLTTDTTDTVARSVKAQPGAIGYVSLYYAKKYNLNILSIDGVSPTDSTSVKSGAYKFWNIEHMYTKGPASGLTKDFIGHMFSDAARQVINDDAYLSTADFAPSVLAHHISQ